MEFLTGNNSEGKIDRIVSFACLFTSSYSLDKMLFSIILERENYLFLFIIIIIIHLFYLLIL